MSRDIQILLMRSSCKGLWENTDSDAMTKKKNHDHAKSIFWNFRLLTTQWRS